MRKLIPGNYNIICKGKSGQLIETSPGLGPATPRDRIFYIQANRPAGVVSDGSYIYFSTNTFVPGGGASGVRQRIYKYSTVDAERIWTIKLLYVYHGINDLFSDYSAGHLFVLGDYVYLHKNESYGSYFQRYSKIDGSKYGGVLGKTTVDLFPGETRNFIWGNNCFVDGNYIYAWYLYTAGWKLEFYLCKLDSNLNQISSVMLDIETPLASYEGRMDSNYPGFILGWDGSHICGGYFAYYWQPDPPEDAYRRSMWAKWSLSGGVPASTWLYYDGDPDNKRVNSGCGSNSRIVGDQIWALGEYHDCDDPPWGPLNPEKNAMYYNSNWRHTAIPTYYPTIDDGFYDGSFYRGRYGEGFSYDHRERQIAKHNDKLYVTLDPHGPGGHDDMVGVHEMTTDGVYRNVHII